MMPPPFSACHPAHSPDSRMIGAVSFDGQMNRPIRKTSTVSSNVLVKGNITSRFPMRNRRSPGNLPNPSFCNHGCSAVRTMSPMNSVTTKRIGLLTTSGLQRVRAVTSREADQRPGNTTSDRENLEQLTHLGFRQQALHCARPCRRVICGKQVQQAAIEEEFRLCGIPEHVKPTAEGRLRDRGPIDVRSDVV